MIVAASSSVAIGDARYYGRGKDSPLSFILGTTNELVNFVGVAQRTLYEGCGHQRNHLAQNRTHLTTLTQEKLVSTDCELLEQFNVDIRRARHGVVIRAARLEVGTAFFCEAVRQHTIGVATCCSTLTRTGIESDTLVPRVDSFRGQAVAVHAVLITNDSVWASGMTIVDCIFELADG